MKKYSITEITKEFENTDNLIYIFISKIKEISQTELRLNKDIYLNENEYIQLKEYLELSFKQNIPPQYIVGEVNIYNEKYIVNESVLIPRSDTEILIEESIKLINENGLKSMLDLCTGSGVVGISIAKNSNIENILMSDISEEALKVANMNILKNKAEHKCKTICSDMFEEFSKIKQKIMNNVFKFDIITSNPPYIETDVIYTLSEYVKKEPNIALDGGISGLDFYNIIYKDAREYLNDNGFLAVEIGWNQAKKVVNIISLYKEYFDIQVIKDLNNKDRVVICRFHKI